MLNATNYRYEHNELKLITKHFSNKFDSGKKIFIYFSSLKDDTDAEYLTITSLINQENIHRLIHG